MIREDDIGYLTEGDGEPTVDFDGSTLDPRPATLIGGPESELEMK
jgi:hypothetical protein